MPVFEQCCGPEAHADGASYSSEPSVVVSDELPGFRHDPQRRVPRLEYPYEPVTRQAGGVGNIEDSELDSIEPHQTVERGEPDIPGLTLADLRYRVDWQAVAYGPCFADERRSFVRIGGVWPLRDSNTGRDRDQQAGEQPVIEE